MNIVLTFKAMMIITKNCNLLAIILNVLLFSFLQDMESLEAPQCQLDFSPIYSITSSIVSFFLPCIIMLIIYFHLFAIAKHHLKEMKYVKSFFSYTRKLRKYVV